MNKSTVLLASLAALLMASQLSLAQSDGAIQLSLNRRYGRALFSSCELTVTISAGTGSSLMQCFRVPGAASPPDLLQNRTLAARDVTEILRLSRASDLFAGGHVGSDATAGDGLFETLKVTESGRKTAVLVSSGNATFESGSRRELIVLLHAMLNEMQRAATQE